MTVNKWYYWVFLTYFMFPNMNSLNTCIKLRKVNILTILLRYLCGIKRWFISVFWESSCSINVLLQGLVALRPGNCRSVCLCLCRNSFYESLKQIGSTQHQGNTGLGTYETIQHFNDIKEHLHTVKRDVEHLVQRNAQVRIRAQNLPF